MYSFSYHSVFRTENMKNTKNTESKTVIKFQKNDDCFFTYSFRK